MPTRNINLTEHFDTFIERRVASGEYGNASEVVREGLRLLEEKRQLRDAKLRALRKAARDGFDSLDRGEGGHLHSREEIEIMLNGIERELKNGSSKSTA